MSKQAKRLSKDEVQKAVVDLANQFGEVLRTVQSGICSPSSLQGLMDAMKHFNDRRPFSVVSGKEQTKKPSPRARKTKKKKLELLSTSIKEVGLSKRAVNYLKQFGVGLVGEIHRLIPGRRKALSVVEITEFLQKNDIPWDQSPFEHGWSPPYWRDQAFLMLLDRPIADAYDNGVRAQSWVSLNRRGVHWIGCLLDQEGNRREPVPGDKLRTFEARSRKLRSLFRMAMWLPMDWSAPEVLPAEWQEVMEYQSFMRTLLTTAVRMELENELCSALLNDRRYGYHMQRLNTIVARIHWVKTLYDLVSSSRQSILNEVGPGNTAALETSLAGIGLRLHMSETEIASLAKSYTAPESLWFLLQ